MSDYSGTVFLPQTNFPMKASLAVVEPRLLQKWEQNQTYFKMQARAKETGKPEFIVADGPPYANGSIHIGHVLNKILKDMLVKYYVLNGQPSPLTPGWDCHGLPIELKALTKKPDDLREACHQEALKWVEHQKQQFMRLGIFADWEHPYLTLQPEYVAAELRLLAKIVRQGHVYHGLKPVYWCPKLGTALAAAEAEYQEVESPSIYVKFKLVGTDDYLVIWTTTPWTLPANEAVCLNPNLSYTKYRVTPGFGSETWILASSTAWILFQDLGITDYEEVEYYNGALSHLEGKYVKHPFYDKQVPIIFGDHVVGTGTGCVHTAPGHGLDDYKAGLPHHLPITCIVTPYGKMHLPEDLELHGLSLEEANTQVCERLSKKGMLVSQETIRHSYPHNPRTKTPLIFRATPQWFIRYDDLRGAALEALENVKFIPEAGRTRLSASIDNSPDWCLSRQRTWGVTIPARICADCNQGQIKADFIEELTQRMVTGEHLTGPDGLPRPLTFDLSDFLCPCGSKNSQLEKSILDVWFDSGAYHETLPMADIYLEGSDQHRGWFQTSLMSAVAAGKAVPFKTIVTHGFVLDEQGRKMSKSLGNVIEPEAVINKYGAEILHLWVASEDFTKDVKVGLKHFERLADSYRKFRNTFRFLLGGLADFRPEMLLAYEVLSPLDRWMLHQLNEVTRECHSAYRELRFHEMYQRLNRFFCVEVSSLYFDVIKGSLYTDGRDWIRRRAIQTVMWHMLDVLHRLMAPCLSFLAEEVAESAGWESPFLRDYPLATERWDNGTLDEFMKKAVSVRDEVYKLLDTMRAEKLLGSSLEALVEVTLDFDDVVNLDWEQFLIVSRSRVMRGDERALQVLVNDAPKCERCWVRTYNRTGDVCQKCVGVLKESGH
jgi:isoleucyl-tRNA synthetase